MRTTERDEPRLVEDRAFASFCADTHDDLYRALLLTLGDADVGRGTEPDGVATDVRLGRTTAAAELAVCPYRPLSG